MRQDLGHRNDDFYRHRDYIVHQQQQQQQQQQQHSYDHLPPIRRTAAAAVVVTAAAAGRRASLNGGRPPATIAAAAPRILINSLVTLTTADTGYRGSTDSTNSFNDGNDDDDVDAKALFRADDENFKRNSNNTFNMMTTTTGLERQSTTLTTRQRTFGGDRSLHSRGIAAITSMPRNLITHRSDRPTANGLQPIIMTSSQRLVTSSQRIMTSMQQQKKQQRLTRRTSTMAQKWMRRRPSKNNLARSFSSLISIESTGIDEPHRPGGAAAGRADDDDRPHADRPHADAAPALRRNDSDWLLDSQWTESPTPTAGGALERLGVDYDLDVESGRLLPLNEFNLERHRKAIDDIDEVSPTDDAVADRITDWLDVLHLVGGAEYPPAQDPIDDTPSQTDTALHIVYNGD